MAMEGMLSMGGSSSSLRGREGEEGEAGEGRDRIDGGRREGSMTYSLSGRLSVGLEMISR